MYMEHKKHTVQAGRDDRRLTFLGAAVLLGAVGGSLLWPRWPALQTLLPARPACPSFWESLLPDGILLGLMLLWSLVPWGCLPALVTAGAKGLLLAAGAAGITASGTGGWLQGICLELLPGCISLTAVLLLGRQAMAMALRRQAAGKKRAVPPDSARLLSAAICALLAVAAALLRCRLSPFLWQTVQRILGQG